MINKKVFLDNVTRNQNGCLEWTGALSEGYGVFSMKGKPVRSHVYAWWMYYGVWPTKFVCHHCDNRKCIEKTHLFEGTAKDNAQDAARKGRMGRKNKLTWHERNLLRLALADKRLTQREIGEIFGVGQATVRECKFFLHEAKL